MGPAPTDDPRPTGGRLARIRIERHLMPVPVMNVAAIDIAWQTSTSVFGTASVLVEQVAAHDGSAVRPEP
jgi:hypothetical protein